MKRILLLVFLLFSVVRGYSQDGGNVIIGLYAGGGLATSYNYDVAISGGLDFTKGIFYSSSIGFNLFYQQFGLLYDDEAFGAKNGAGEAGVMVYNKSSYVFLAPKYSHSLGRSQSIKYYFNVGVGFNMGGTETLRKWDHQNGTLGNYDSVINTSADINKMLIRVGLGFKEYVRVGTKWWFTVTEDGGFLTKSISTTSDADNGSRTVYSPHSLNPVFISLQIGISHSKF